MRKRECCSVSAGKQGPVALFPEARRAHPAILRYVWLLQNCCGQRDSCQSPCGLVILQHASPRLLHNMDSTGPESAPESVPIRKTTGNEWELRVSWLLSTHEEQFTIGFTATVHPYGFLLLSDSRVHPFAGQDSSSANKIIH